MKSLKLILSDDVFKHGSIFFIGFMGFSIMNYLFHFTMGRMLGPTEYGILGLLMSIVYILMAPLTTIQTVITKFTAKFRAERLFEKIKCLFIQSIKKMFIFSAAITTIFVILSRYIADFFNIADRNIIITFSLSFLVFFLLAISRGFLQGLEKFRALSTSYLLEGAIKLSLSVALVYFGFRIFGAIGAIILGAAIALAFTLILLKAPKEFKRVESKEIYKYAIPVLLSITIITLIYNIDVLLVKHYLSDVQAGLYVALATLAKIVFWAGMSISFVMFPKVAEKFSEGKEHFSIFKKSVYMVSAITAVFLSVYIGLPRFSVLLLYGSQYLEIASLLVRFSIAMAFLSYSYLIINYLLSVNKFRFIYFLVGIFIVETICIVLYHKTLAEVVNVLFITNAILLLYLTFDLIKNEIISNNSGVQRRESN